MAASVIIPAPVAVMAQVPATNIDAAVETGIKAVMVIAVVLTAICAKVVAQ